jgi:hypothetical protein
VAEQQQLVVSEEMPLCLTVQQSDVIFDIRNRLIWWAGHAVCGQQLSSSRSRCCFWLIDSTSAARAGQQHYVIQLLKYLDVVTYASGACAGADTTGNQGGRLGHLPAADLIRQGVDAVGCHIQGFGCSKPAAVAAAEAVCATADSLTCAVTMAANEPMSNGSGSSSSSSEGARPCAVAQMYNMRC